MLGRQLSHIRSLMKSEEQTLGLLLARPDGFELHGYLLIPIFLDPHTDRHSFGGVFTLAVLVRLLEGFQRIVTRRQVLEHVLIAARMNAPCPAAPADHRQAVGPDQADRGIFDRLSGLCVDDV